MMTRLGRLKLIAIAVPLGALLILGASQTANFPTRVGGSEDAVNTACAQPSKIFQFTLNEQDRARVSALKVRVAPAVDPSQLRFTPAIEEMDFDPEDGMLQVRYFARTLLTAAALKMELCGATPMHEVREAYWIVRQLGRPVTQRVDAGRIDWQWRDSGQQAIPNTQLITKELSCAGEPLVQSYQLLAEDEPLCVKDPASLAEIQKQINDLQLERVSFTGKLNALLFGERQYEERLAALTDAAQRLYLRAPYAGMVLGVTYDQRNGLAWIKIQVEEGMDIRVSP
ncbi:MAG: hypothetical protein A2Z21_01655 [Candidatus Fraserbacteria bacterium RBG_16_55_9]|uniref:Uncharacterized protein n=1 Tax=Fraserbacteria sp. (strain RBG_16_55_9) TaxID=1817864 RepID=A0A1F5UWY0_FRAXR|nr:MAG: hypothetical protein A2Z21_01655 [Candidatus Fraserbacteria bacterium RBG_16_55_9]